ncbi:hemicentin-1-like, partial [Actinia tenebrosa]|uniref:Hemicentin-1-like n=1 Tax=Actinia tenebrosa TaxID=6105 RepID=A0A6P8IFX0_ACTTE
MFAVAVFVLVLVQIATFTFTEGLSIDWTPDKATKVTGIEGQGVDITWKADFKQFDGIETKWTFVKVYRDGRQIIKCTRGRNPPTFVYPDFVNRESHLKLNASQDGTNVTIVFTLTNLTTKDNNTLYKVLLTHDEDSETIPYFTTLIIENSPLITSPKSNINVNTQEKRTVNLNCVATGNPFPNINWTKDGVIVGTGSPLRLDNVTIKNISECYTCVAYNGIPPDKSVTMCLNVQYTPKKVTIVADKKTVCLNGNITLTCLMERANPPVFGYDFYHNNVSTAINQSNIYIANASFPNNNTFYCVAKNLVGDIPSDSVQVKVKDPPVIIVPPQNMTVTEGSDVNFTITINGTEPLAVYWNTSGQFVEALNGRVIYLQKVNRTDEGRVVVTVKNGNECPRAEADAYLTVDYKPEKTYLTTNKANNTFMTGESVTLFCSSNSKPQTCKITFYDESHVIGSYPDSTCNGSVSASHVIQSIDGCNLEQYSCKAENKYDYGEAKINLTIQVPVNMSLNPSRNFIIKDEGKTLKILCIATGCPTPNITWTKIEGMQRLINTTTGNSLSLRFDSLRRQDTGGYLCTVDNRVAGGPMNRSIYINVTYKPEHTIISTNRSNNTFLKGEHVKLSCASTSKPQLCNVTFYHGNTVIQSYYNKTCAGADAASHVIHSIDGCNLEEYSCRA